MHNAIEVERKEAVQAKQTEKQNREISDMVGVSGFSDHHSCFFEGPGAQPLDPCDAPLVIDYLRPMNAVKIGLGTTIGVSVPPPAKHVHGAVLGL